MKAIYPVDIDGDFPWQRVINFAKAKGQSQIMDQIMSEIGEMVKAAGRLPPFAQRPRDAALYERRQEGRAGRRILLIAKPTLENRATMPDRTCWPAGISGTFASTTISSNIIESPNERVLVIYGAGHLGWLRQVVDNDPGLRLRKLSEFVSPKTK